MARVISTILCPTDFSPAADLALEEAVELARRFSARLVLIHALEPLPVGPVYASFDVPAFTTELSREAERRLAGMKEKLEKEGFSVTVAVAGGFPQEVILKEAENQKADLIVMATHGRRGWKKLVFGSVTEKMLKLAPCPILVVPAPREE